MNILFVDGINSHISRTAEISFSMNHKDHRFRSAGIWKHLTEPLGGVMVNLPLLKWSDYIVCTNEVQESFIVRMFGDTFQTKIKVIHFNTETEEYLSENLIYKLEKACQNLGL